MFIALIGFMAVVMAFSLILTITYGNPRRNRRGYRLFGQDRRGARSLEPGKASP